MLTLACFAEKQVRHLHQKPQPHILHGHTTYAAPPLPNPNLPAAAPASGVRRGARRKLEMLRMQRGSKLILGQPASMLGGDRCSHEPGWDECVAELVAVFCTLLLGIACFQLAPLSQLLFPRPDGLNNCFSRHEAICQNRQSFLTKFRDRIQRLFPTWAHVSRRAK